MSAAEGAGFGLQPALQPRIAQVLQLNRNHQQTLRTYIADLRSKLAQADTLLEDLTLSDEDEEDEDADVGGHLEIPGAEAPSSILDIQDFIGGDSPFRRDSAHRDRYVDTVSGHIMSAKTIEALGDAVRAENYRIHAYEIQQRGEQPLTALANKPREYFEQNLEGIRWEDVAAKVSGPVGSFTAEECRIKWLGSLHPSINRAPWSDEEITSLKVLAQQASNGGVDWVAVAEDLGTGRTALDCMRHAQPKTVAFKWNARTDDRLLEAVQKYGTDNWYLVARHVSEVATPVQCEGRYARIRPDLKKLLWTEEEDERLRQACKVYDKSWADVAMMIHGRSNQQCSERWNELSLGSRTPVPEQQAGWRYNPLWTREEEKRLWDAARGRKSVDWTEVTARLGTERVAKACRIRFRQVGKKLADNPSYFDDVAVPHEPTPPQAEHESHSPHRTKRRPKRSRIAEAEQHVSETDENVPDPAPPMRKTKPKPRRVIATVMSKPTGTDASAGPSALPSGLDLLSSVASAVRTSVPPTANADDGATSSPLSTLSDEVDDTTSNDDAAAPTPPVRERCGRGRARGRARGRGRGRGDK